MHFNLTLTVGFYQQVKEDSYKEHQKLLLQVENVKKPNPCSEPYYIHVAHQRKSKKDLARSEGILQKLDNFTALINHMTVQCLTVVTQQDARFFLRHALKVSSSGVSSIIKEKLWITLGLIWYIHYKFSIPYC